MAANKTKFTPVLRLENGIYTRNEWLCILQSMHFDRGDLAITLDHLSKNRIR